MAEPGFPEGGAVIPERDVRTYYFAIILQKLQEKFENLDRGLSSLAPLIGSGTVLQLAHYGIGYLSVETQSGYHQYVRNSAIESSQSV